MEPDLYVFAGAPAGVSGAHAGDHIVGPSQGEGRGERIPGRGKKSRHHPSRTLTDSISANPLQWGQALDKALTWLWGSGPCRTRTLSCGVFIYCVKP